MNHRIVWPVAGLLGLVLLAVGISTVPAQVRPMPFLAPRQVGRFVVAHATEKQIIILDTTTGKLYKAGRDDFQKYSDLPKIGDAHAVPRRADQGPAGATRTRTARDDEDVPRTGPTRRTRTRGEEDRAERKTRSRTSDLACESSHARKAEPRSAFRRCLDQDPTMYRLALLARPARRRPPSPAR